MNDPSASGEDAQARPVPRPFIYLLLACLVLLAKLFWPLRVPLFVSIGCAAVTRPVYDRLVPRLGDRPRTAGLVMTLGFLLCIIAPLVSVGVALSNEVDNGLHWMSDSLGVPENDPASLPDGMERALGKIADTIHVSRDDVRGFLGRLAQTVEESVPVMLGVSLGLFGGTLLLLIGFYFFTVDGHLITRFLLRASPLRPQETRALINDFRDTCSGALLSNASNCIAQGAVMGIGFLVAGVPHALFFAIMGIFAALIPLIGSFLVWIPAVLILASHDETTKALALGIWCLVMVAVVDNTVKPLVLRGKLDLHGGMLLVGFVGGVAAFGPIGLLVGPIVIAFSLTLLRIYQRDYL